MFSKDLVSVQPCQLLRICVKEVLFNVAVKGEFLNEFTPLTVSRISESSLELIPWPLKGSVNVGRWYPLLEPAEGPSSMQPFSECGLRCMLDFSPGVSVEDKA